MSKWKKHKDWLACKKCELHETRKNVVLAKGKLPCDILFIGEAPGVSEDIIGSPFVGPAGKLLDKIIAGAGIENRTAFTNLISCIPLDPDGNKVHTPDKCHIQACGERLCEFFTIAKPSGVVFVGGLAKKWSPKILGNLLGTLPTTSITHPAAILRAEGSQRGLAIQQSVVRLMDLVQELG